MTQVDAKRQLDPGLRRDDGAADGIPLPGGGGPAPRRDTGWGLLHHIPNTADRNDARKRTKYAQLNAQ